MQQNGKLKFYARQLQNCTKFKFWKMQKVHRLLICIFLNNFIKYCIRKSTIFSERRKVQVTVLYITLTPEVWRLILSLVSSRLSLHTHTKTLQNNSWLLPKYYCLFAQSVLQVLERDYRDDLKERSLIKHSMNKSRFSIVRKVLKSGVYIFVSETSNQSIMPLEGCQKYFIGFK